MFINKNREGKIKIPHINRNVIAIAIIVSVAVLLIFVTYMVRGKEQHHIDEVHATEIQKNKERNANKKKLLANMNSNQNSHSSITTYTHKGSSNEWEDYQFHASCSIDEHGQASSSLHFGTADTSWILFDTIKVYIDDAEFSIQVNTDDINTIISKQLKKEYGFMSFDECEDILVSLGGAQKVIIRFYGLDYYREYTMSPDEAQQIHDVYQLYKILNEEYEEKI